MPIDMSAAKAPPARAQRAKAANRANSAAQVTVNSGFTSAEMRFDGLMGLGQLGQGACLMTKQYAQAATFGQHWQPIAKELTNLSQSQPTVAKYVDLIIAVGPYAALIQAVTPFLMQTAANYGLINAESATGGGIVPPAVLEAQMKADYARMQAQAIREQQEAIQEAQRAQAEYNHAVAQAQAAQRQHEMSVNGNGPKTNDTTTVSQ